MAREDFPEDFGSPYEPEDHAKHLRVLVDALAEYAGKLRAASDAMYRLRWRATFAALGGGAVLLVGGSWFILAVIDPAAKNPSLFQILVTIPVAGLTALLTALVISAVLSEFRHARQVAQEVAILTEQMSRLIHLTAQFEEHGKIDFSEKMLLNLRLAEAEAAVRLSYGSRKGLRK
jgi:hypothetical protein